MTIDIEEVLERAFEQAFLRALDQTVQAKAEELFKRMLATGSPLSKKLEDCTFRDFLILECSKTS